MNCRDVYTPCVKSTNDPLEPPAYRRARSGRWGRRDRKVVGMATTTMPAPSNAPRLVVAGLMGLLVGATVSGVVTWTVRSAQLTNETAAAPAAVEQLSPEGIRAGFAYVPPAAVEPFSPERIRVLNR